MLFFKADKCYVLYWSCINMYKRQHIKFKKQDEHYLIKIIVDFSAYKP